MYYFVVNLKSLNHFGFINLSKYEDLSSSDICLEYASDSLVNWSLKIEAPNKNFKLPKTGRSSSPACLAILNLHKHTHPPPEIGQIQAKTN